MILSWFYQSELDIFDSVKNKNNTAMNCDEDEDDEDENDHDAEINKPSYDEMLKSFETTRRTVLNQLTFVIARESAFTNVNSFGVSTHCFRRSWEPLYEVPPRSLLRPAHKSIQTSLEEKWRTNATEFQMFTDGSKTDKPLLSVSSAMDIFITNGGPI
ncbi:hypothetical protein AVEN_165272-1 [Araneus ventricosus]|uniref:Uncharacterized protein n=1 Tax=Araneus ventricosus TaxID=182803 RepID=A0A4Y2ATI5_ARAVE|nr:hypothetical protein AVEN_165272-1 [Araneus ventricosus]